MTHIRVMLEQLVSSFVQIGAALVITLLQRWILELSTIEKDIAWFKRTRFYQLWQESKWFRGIEAWHQYRAWKILYEFRTS